MSDTAEIDVTGMAIGEGKQLVTQAKIHVGSEYNTVAQESAIR